MPFPHVPGGGKVTGDFTIREEFARFAMDIWRSGGYNDFKYVLTTLSDCFPRL